MLVEIQSFCKFRKEDFVSSKRKIKQNCLTQVFYFSRFWCKKMPSIAYQLQIYFYSFSVLSFVFCNITRVVLKLNMNNKVSIIFYFDSHCIFLLIASVMQCKHTITVKKEEKKSNNRTPKKGNCCICYEMKVDSVLYR